MTPRAHRPDTAAGIGGSSVGTPEGFQLAVDSITPGMMGPTWVVQNGVRLFLVDDMATSDLTFLDDGCGGAALGGGLKGVSSMLGNMNLRGNGPAPAEESSSFHRFDGMPQRTFDQHLSGSSNVDEGDSVHARKKFEEMRNARTAAPELQLRGYAKSRAPAAMRWTWMVQAGLSCRGPSPYYLHPHGGRRSDGIAHGQQVYDRMPQRRGSGSRGKGAAQLGQQYQGRFLFA